MPRAISILWQILADENLLPAAKKDLMLDFDKVLGLKLDKVKPAKLPLKVKKLVGERENLRQQKEWLGADKVRAQIEKEGWLVEDTPQGPKLIEKQIKV
jgi:cysteinyl-tRNA synthetase